MAKPLAMKQSKLKLAGLVLLSVAMALISLVNIREGGVFIGGIGLAFFGFAAVTLFLKIVRNKPSVVVDERGISDNSAVINAGFIPWSDIERVFLTQIAGNTSIAIVPRDPEAFMNKYNPAMKKLMQVNMSMMNFPVGLPASALALPAGKLIKQMEVYLSASQASDTASTPSIQFESEISLFKRWNWGAFLLSPVWGVFNGAAIKGFLALLPVIGIIFSIMLGYSGNRIAWKARHWESEEQFEKSQRSWAVAGFIFAGIVSMPLFVLALRTLN
jgi:hypothetical protein